MQVSKMSFYKQIRKREEGSSRRITDIRSDLQKEWDSLEPKLLCEFQAFALHKMYKIYDSIEEIDENTQTYAYVYEDTRGKKFLYALVRVTKSAIRSVNLTQASIWNGKDIDISWFENLPLDFQPQNDEEKSVWNQAFWNRYSYKWVDGACKSLVCLLPRDVVDFCKDMVMIFANDLKLLQQSPSQRGWRYL